MNGTGAAWGVVIVAVSILESEASSSKHCSPWVPMIDTSISMSPMVISFPIRRLYADSILLMPEEAGGENEEPQVNRVEKTGGSAAILQ